MNKVMLIGYVGKQPEIHTFPTGSRVANFSLATAERWTDKKTGDKKERTEWHRIAVFNDHLVSIIENFVKVGSMIFLEGQIESRKYTDAQGVQKQTVDIVLRPHKGNVQLLDDAPPSGASPQHVAKTSPPLDPFDSAPNF